MNAVLRRTLLLGPALVVLVGVFGGALLVALREALGVGLFASGSGLTLRFFGDVLGGTEFGPSLAYTIYVALAATILSTSLGVVIAWALVKGFRGERSFAFVSRVPVLVPHLVAAFVVLSLLAPTGMLSRILLQAGIIRDDLDFPLLVNDPGAFGILFLYMWKEAPFVAIVVGGTMRSIDETVIAQARNLGASESKLFRHVLLPLSLPSIATASIIVFAFAFGSYEIPALLGRLSPTTLPVLAVNRFQNPADLTLDWPRAMAASTILAAAGIALAAAYLTAMRAMRKGAGS